MEGCTNWHLRITRHSLCLRSWYLIGLQRIPPVITDLSDRYEDICKYGFAFEGKKVLIGKNGR